MNPFALQEAARKKTGVLVVLAAMAVASVVAAATLVFLFAEWLFAFNFSREFSRPAPAFGEICQDPVFLGIAIGLAVLIVVIGFLIKSDSVSSGWRLMETLGARRIRRGELRADGDAAAVDRLRLFNVCEEMAIASGVDMPSVWVLEGERGVNAFVAGHDPSSSALCVTEGALRHLTRDELQGVVAHEFSHILNGDMRLNFRLLMLIAGVTAFNRLGKGMFGVFGRGKDSGGGSGFRFRSSGKGKGGAILLVYFTVAALLWLIGAIGAFFARLIQSAVSREREYLADASAVQFTRNPEGLANALRLAHLAECSCCTKFTAWRGDVAHMLFTEGDRLSFATHPPVRDRVARLSPGGIHADGPLKARIARIRAERASAAAEAERRFGESQVKAPVAPVERELPPAFNAQLRDASAAGAALVQLLRGRSPSGLDRDLTSAERRSLVKKCAIVLRDAETSASRAKWIEAIDAIVKEDGQFDSFEFMVTAAVRRYLRPWQEVRIVPAARLRDDAAKVLATVASFGTRPPAGYAAALGALSLFGGPFPPLPPACDDALGFLDLLARLEALSPLAKRELLNAVAAAVAEDGRVTDEEGDYVSAVADAIAAFGWKQDRESAAR
jgi:Zn-dependent protease with chaperone function